MNKENKLSIGKTKWVDDGCTADTNHHLNQLTIKTINHEYYFETIRILTY